MDPSVIVLAHTRVRGGRSTIEAEPLPLSEALTRRFPGDAHMQPATQIIAGSYTKLEGTPPKTARRRTCNADIGRSRILIVAAAFDFDAPNHEVTGPWWEEQREPLRALASAHPGGFAYRTRGGFRVVWALAQPFELRAPAASAGWTGRYLALCDRWEGFGLVPDRSCADPFRLFRLPHSTRDPGGKPEELETIGDPHAIGVLELPPAPASVPPPRPLAAPSPTPVPSAAAKGRGVVWWLLQARGAILHELRPGAWAVRCPRAQRHTCGREGDGSTVLFPATSDGGDGLLICRHAHCEELRIADWLRELGAPPREVRRGRVQRCIVDRYDHSVRMCCTLGATDGGERLPYLRVTAGTTAWTALWGSTGVEAPSDLDEEADLGAAIDELIGRELEIELNGRAVRRIRRAGEAA